LFVVGGLKGRKGRKRFERFFGWFGIKKLVSLSGGRG